MLRIYTSSPSPLCDRLPRRDFLRIAGCGLGGSALPGLPGATLANSAIKAYAKDKSVVLLFLAGGPSQFETFDPKRDGHTSRKSLLRNTLDRASRLGTTPPANSSASAN
jgi:hypothetical protein